MLRTPTTQHHITLDQMLANPSIHKGRARMEGAELVLHLHPRDRKAGENERNPYGYVGVKGTRALTTADKVVIHLAEGGQFVAKDKYRSESLGVVPPFVRSGATAKSGIGWRVAVAGSTVLVAILGVTFDLSRNMTLLVLLLLVGAVLLRSLGELLGEDVGVLPGDEPWNSR